MPSCLVCTSPMGGLHAAGVPRMLWILSPQEVSLQALCCACWAYPQHPIEGMCSRAVGAEAVGLYIAVALWRQGKA